MHHTKVLHSNQVNQCRTTPISPRNAFTMPYEVSCVDTAVPQITTSRLTEPSLSPPLEGKTKIHTTETFQRTEEVDAPPAIIYAGKWSARLSS